MERPNTVAGLIAKRSELLGEFRLARDKVASLQADLDALDRVIRLFAPEIDGRSIRARAAPSLYRAEKGDTRRAVLAALREATAPITTLDIARQIITRRNLPTDDKTVMLIRKRAGAVMFKLAQAGAVEEVSSQGEFKLWRLVAR